TASGMPYEAAHCLIATARDAATLLPDSPLKLHAVAGQISAIAATGVATPLRTILCHKGYIVPAGDQYFIGATYDHGDDSLAVTPENHARNMAEVESFLPGWLRGQPVGGRTAMRATTPDRLPYIGMLEEGLWISVGHG